MLLFAGEHPTPLIVEFVNYYIGEPLHKIQMETTYEFWSGSSQSSGRLPKRCSVLIPRKCRSLVR